MSDIKLISTSALAKKLSISKSKLDKQLLEVNYIIENDNGYKLTKLGIENSGAMKKHAKFGEYIVWDENIKIPNRLISQEKEFFSSTKIALRYNLSSRKINMLLSKIVVFKKKTQTMEYLMLSGINPFFQIVFLYP